MNATASPPPPHPHGIELAPGRCSKYLLGKCLEMEEQRLLSGNWGSLHSRASPSPSRWSFRPLGRGGGVWPPAGVFTPLLPGGGHLPGGANEPETGACRCVPSQEAVPGAGTRVVSAETSPPGRGSRDKDRCGLRAARNLVGNSIPMRQLFILRSGSLCYARPPSGHRDPDSGGSRLRRLPGGQERAPQLRSMVSGHELPRSSQEG